MSSDKSDQLVRAPALDPDNLETVIGCLPPPCPPPYDELLATRRKRVVGDALGLTDFGVNIVELPPGAMSSLRHWHSHEDEFIYVLKGSVTLVTDAGEQMLRAGMVAGFPKGKPDGHHLKNTSSQMATILEVGSRHPADMAEYSDIDMKASRRTGFTTKAGEPLK